VISLRAKLKSIAHRRLNGAVIRLKVGVLMGRVAFRLGLVLFTSFQRFLMVSIGTPSVSRTPDRAGSLILNPKNSVQHQQVRIKTTNHAEDVVFNFSRQEIEYYSPAQERKIKMHDKYAIASDYAICEAGDLRFYFGYEFTLCKCGKDSNCECEEKEWCFIASNNGEEIMRIPQSKLGLDFGLDMSEYLLAGIGFYGDKHWKE